MPGPITSQLSRLVRNADNVPPLHLLAGVGAFLAGLTLVTPFAFRHYGDNAFIALTIIAGLLAIVATGLAERAPPDRALWLIVGGGDMRLWRAVGEGLHDMFQPVVIAP